MFFLPFLIEKEKGNFLFYPGKPEFENLLNLKKIKLFNHNYFSGNLDQIKKEFYLYPDDYKNKSIEFIKNFESPPKYFVVEDKKFPLDKIYLVGILNVTPDSFSDGNIYFEKEKAIERGIQMVEEGADIIDVGGQSTRPGSEEVGEEEELKRVIPVIEELSKKIKVPISIDTTKARVAEEAFKAGARILNDISALHFDEKMVDFISNWKPSLFLMHIKGKPKDMQKNTEYDHFPFDILSFLFDGIKKAKDCKIEKEKILLDPGIGFGKDLNQNLWIIKNISFLKILGCSILIGTSRKSFIGKILGNQPMERLNGTLASNLVAVKKGVKFLRVHDVRAHKEFFKILETIEND